MRSPEPSFAGVSTRSGSMCLNGVCKGFGRGPARSEILRDVNLTVGGGEFVAIVGPSGAGKTTLISLLAGLSRPGAGEVTLDNRPITGPGPDRGVVFQNYSLLPWLSVADNIALAVDEVFPHESAETRAARVAEAIGKVNLTPAAHKKPSELSGGMRQRVSVARALAMDPRVLLLDEPLSALDALTRATLQDEIERLWRTDRKTVLLITNDVDEGILLADRIVPLVPAIGIAGAPTGAHTLGEPVPVTLQRPRDRKAINHSDTFKAIRRDVFSRLRRKTGHSAAPHPGDAAPSGGHPASPNGHAASANGRGAASSAACGSSASTAWSLRPATTLKPIDLTPTPGGFALSGLAAMGERLRYVP